MIWEGSKRNQLILGTPFLATAGAVLNYFGNHLSFGHIRQDIFFPSVNFRSVPSATKLPPEEATLMPKKEAVMHGEEERIRIFTPKDSELKGDQSIEEKLERTMKLFPKALVFKDDVRDDMARQHHHKNPLHRRMEKLKGSFALQPLFTTIKEREGVKLNDLKQKRFMGGNPYGF
ncbi:unnamed protein product [Microthlaspi erraticum]|uniref:Uncharacterized protein n=1 Tax=Microthlaspi erraticum TaxID=1685480 RepID=A0A6D2KMZ6_9BRAS|nr:unnamed protein product [Microthlaspi erraticum]